MHTPLQRITLTLVVALGLILLPAATWAQAPAPCGCPQNFAAAQQLLKTNYSGYRDKVTAATQPRLDSLVAALQPQVAAATDAGACQQVLLQYLRFFRDGHVQLLGGPAGRLNADSLRARFASTARLPWTRTSFRAYLDDPTCPKKPLEGIWHDESGGNYVVGIVADATAGYQGFIIKSDSTYWVPGQVKFRFADPAAGPVTATFYMRDHSVQLRPTQVVGEGMLDIGGSWRRVYPQPTGTPAAQASAFALHSFQMLDDTTALYRIASFDPSYRLKIDSITKANAANLARTRLLIVDVRGNGGGGDGSYGSLVPYLYTNPVVERSAAIYSTPENNSTYANPSWPGMSASEKKFYAGLKRRLDAHPGQLVPMSPLGRKNYTVRRKRRQLHPELTRVAVLQNRFCASTTEQFLLLARQSKKTTTFGENSEGVLDYSNVHQAALPCYHQRLGWAMSRSFRIDRGEGIDNVGIAPAVRLDPASPTLVEQVRAWYRQRH